ncbi:MAG TPA: ectoine/hydroxyectoine ABC transporter substrate-binding protein EhuB [Segeticoccus sp.]|uniref:ectoine/hydroxyectoine ABC transporter substrate-binding protein EhuB n=1 Tax=Segeticoccus sp. TaxID=2706531 RepID=UPI002D7F6051|nr:ectoine/hydroxyectoine ABC transporter substrate-binding protein EhuB [Segeticoccus sp.]HET8600928.1 ectoine/hydroxyectoine ABC transporter substrate-binding protein EhuB [Segeticoccus sp.]
MTHEISRRTLLRGLGAAAVVAPTAAWLSSCSSAEKPPAANAGGTAGATGGATDLLAKGKKQGYLRVGIANEPPYTKVTADGKVTGCEPDVFRAVVKRLGIPDIQGVITPYNGMIPGLKADRWDAITAGLFMKQSRCAEVLYSEPVIVSTESFGVKPGNPRHITTVQDVLDHPDLKIVVLPGGFEEGILQTAKVPDKQLIRINDNRSGVEAVIQGRADAFFLPTLSLRALHEQEKGFEVTPPVEDAPKTGSGAAFRQSDQSFLDVYNAELAKFKQTDEFKKILDKWGFDPSAVKGVTAKELCQNKG